MIGPGSDGRQAQAAWDEPACRLPQPGGLRDGEKLSAPTMEGYPRHAGNSRTKRSRCFSIGSVQPVTEVTPVKLEINASDYRYFHNGIGRRVPVAVALLGALGDRSEPGGRVPS